MFFFLSRKVDLKWEPYSLSTCSFESVNKLLFLLYHHWPCGHQYFAKRKDTTVRISTGRGNSVMESGLNTCCNNKQAGLVLNLVERRLD